jgi:bifunctional DNase/RNase
MNGKEVEIDSRTSDAVAIAIRFKAPIFTYAAILDEAGIILEQDITDEKEAIEHKMVEDSSNFEKFSNSELKESLEKAILEEDYELASKLRDEIEKRK